MGAIVLVITIANTNTPGLGTSAGMSAPVESARVGVGAPEGGSEKNE